MQLQLLHSLVPGCLSFTQGPEQVSLSRYCAGEEWQILGIEWNICFLKLLTVQGHII